jgi:hypothetical protein
MSEKPIIFDGPQVRAIKTFFGDNSEEETLVHGV